MPDLPDLPSTASVELAAALRPAILRLNRQLRRETLSLGVSPLMVMVLTTIGKEPGIGVSDLAVRENMRTATMSTHIKQLEEQGYVVRDQTLHADRRRVGLAITRQAEQLISDVRRLRTDWLAKRVASLPAAERAALAKAVNALTLLGN
jgi:DNA-binding MarR family transcriptional regulator